MADKELEIDFEWIEKNFIEVKKYAPELSSEQEYWPLFLGSSGGNGHIAAIKALIEFLTSYYGKKFMQYELTSPEKKKLTLTHLSIFFASKINYLSYFKKITHLLNLPVLPTQEEITQCIQELKNSTSQKYYIDVLLDVFPIGYESAAIWNIYQRKDQKEELLKLISLQKHNDQLFKNDVTAYYLELLTRARESGKPYTEIISTQVMGLEALCHAVEIYNQRFNENLIIHQYMTDLPTVGAIHFFKPLSLLSFSQQNLIKLYGVNLKSETISAVFPEGQNFRGLYRISPNDNPLIRSGFKNPANDNSQNMDKLIELIPDGSNKITIAPNEKIAAIMLGSQASNDTLQYIRYLCDETDMDKIFIFCGTNQSLINEINLLINAEPHLASRICCLGPQGDNLICSLESRCQMLVIRSGGLSIMEQLAMPHPENQIILLHHSDSDEGTLQSGIIWEDKNADELTESFREEGIKVYKTSPNQVSHLLEKLKNGEMVPFTSLEEEFYDNVEEILQQLEDESWMNFTDEELHTIRI